jgi:hypothetical protein
MKFQAGARTPDEAPSARTAADPQVSTDRPPLSQSLAVLWMLSTPAGAKPGAPPRLANLLCSMRAGTLAFAGSRTDIRFCPED